MLPLLLFLLLEPNEHISLIIPQNGSAQLYSETVQQSLKQKIRLSIIAQEPGPIQLQNELRILPNEVLPRVEDPSLLLIDGTGQWEGGHVLFAYLRKCLMQKIPIYVIGPHFPEFLAEIALSSGQEIQRHNLESLAQIIKNHSPHADEPKTLPSFPFPMFFFFR